MSKNREKKLPPNVEIFDVTGAFFITGMLYYLFKMITGLQMIPDLLEGAPVQNPSGWSLVHLLVLGFATMSVMGAAINLFK